MVASNAYVVNLRLNCLDSSSRLIRGLIISVLIKGLKYLLKIIIIQLNTLHNTEIYIIIFEILFKLSSHLTGYSLWTILQLPIRSSIPLENDTHRKRNIKVINWELFSKIWFKVLSMQYDLITPPMGSKKQEHLKANTPLVFKCNKHFESENFNEPYNHKLCTCFEIINSI